MKRTLLLVLSTVVLWSCNSNSQKSNPNQEKVSQEKQHPNEDAGAIQLNHGEKWPVNNEMKPFVLEGEKLVNSYLQNKKTDYKQLANQIKAQNTMLVKSCTMTGKSHEELHKWLHPHLELVEKLENENENKKAKDIIVELQQSYQTYHQYFN